MIISVVDQEPSPYSRGHQEAEDEWGQGASQRSRDGLDIWFSIWYPAKSGHFSAIRYPAGYRILKNRISGFQISGRISGKPDISMTFLLLFEDKKCFNYLSNSVEQRTGIEISGIRQDIRPDIRYPAPTGYLAGNRVSGF